jgi:hypothetical protein
LGLALAAAVVCGLAAASRTSAVQASGANPGVIPNKGHKYGDLGAEWWQWALSFEMEDVPFFNTGGAVDASAGQSGNVWFLAGANLGPTERTATIPPGKSLFFPIANLVNDYPCPAEFGFEPEPGESLEDFLLRTGNEFMPELDDLFAEIDGESIADLDQYRASSGLFEFTADPDLSAFDPCITGSPQPGVALGYWLLLAPLSPGEHTLHFGSPTWGQDVTYVLTVTPH